MLYDGDICLGGGRIAAPGAQVEAAGAEGAAAVPRRGARMTIGPALPLALLVGLLWTAVYVLVRGHAGGRLLLIYVAAALGAWAGASIGGRLGMSILAVGDFPLIPATLGAWLGIAIVAILATLGPQSGKAR